MVIRSWRVPAVWHPAAGGAILALEMWAVADRPRLRREIMNTGRTVRFGDTRRNHGIMASETTNHHIGLASQHGGQRAVM